MTEIETQTQKDHDETMRVLRAEFATKVWPKVVRKIGVQWVFTPPVAQAAWLGFLAARTAPAS
jgi:hypothetical protein